MKKIRVELNGKGYELTVGEITKEQADFIQSDIENNTGNYVKSSDNEDDNKGWYDYDDVLHVFGAEKEESTLTVYEDDKKVFESSMADVDFYEEGEEDLSVYENPIFADIDCLELNVEKCYIVSRSIEEGNFVVLEVEDEKFDISKLKAKYKVVDDFDFGNLVYNLEYNESGNTGGDTTRKFLEHYLFTEGEFVELK